MFLEKKSTQITEFVIIPIMVLTAIFSGTIFALIQHSLEFLLIIILLFLILPFKLSKIEQFLVAVFVFSQIGSFFLNNFQIFLLNAKQFGLAILSLIYFKRNAAKSFFINITVITCIFLVFFEYIFKKFPFNITPYLSTMQDSYGSRTLGLFLNYHYSSFFLAIFFIGFTLKKKIVYVDYIILWMINAKTNFLGYIMHKLSKTYFTNFFNNTKKLTIFIVSFLVLLVISNEYILESFQSYNYGFQSAYIIIKQIIDPKSILDSLYVFPHDLIKYLAEESLFDFPELGGAENLDRASELSIVHLFVQGGFFLAITYLYVFFKYFKKYNIFIFITLLHYSFFLSPLIIYLMSAYQFDNINNKKE
jgi:hypothetical protein